MAGLVVAVAAVTAAVVLSHRQTPQNGREAGRAVRLALPLPPKPAPAPVIEPPPLAAPVARPAVGAAVVAPPSAASVSPPPPDLPAWKKFAVAAPPVLGRPVIAVVIDDMGLDRRRSARAAALPGPLTLSWLPYAPDVGRQAAAARASGHEVLVHVPMQPQGREDPGPHALTVDLAPEQIHQRLGADLDLLPDAVGVNNHMGSRFTRDVRAMLPVAEELKRRGLLFLDSRTAGGSIAASVAREAGVPTVERDVFLDNEPTVEAVRARLAEVEALARRRGIAIAIGHPHDATIEALEPWLRSLGERGFVLIPISAAVQYRLDRPPPVAARG